MSWQTWSNSVSSLQAPLVVLNFSKCIRISGYMRLLIYIHIYIYILNRKGRERERDLGRFHLCDWSMFWWKRIDNCNKRTWWHMQAVHAPSIIYGPMPPPWYLGKHDALANMNNALSLQAPSEVLNFAKCIRISGYMTLLIYILICTFFFFLISKNDIYTKGYLCRKSTW